MSETIFFRLLDGVNRPSRLAGAIEELREGGETADVYSAEPASLRQVPGSPFAYWVSEKILSKFTKLQPFESEDREVRVGDHPGDGFRYLRLFWEVPAITPSRVWRSYQKGGEYSPYYYDVHLVADWDPSRQTYRDFYGRPGRSSERPSNYQYFFRQGLAWPLRSQKGLSVRVHPAGCVFTNKGPVMFANSASLTSLLALVNSKAFHALAELQVAFGSYEVGVIQRTPVPEMSEEEAERMGSLALRCVEIKRGLDTVNEASHVFKLPALLHLDIGTLQERISGRQKCVAQSSRELEQLQREIDALSFQLYGIEGADRWAIEKPLSIDNDMDISRDGDDTAEMEDVEELTGTLDGSALVTELLSYAVGCVFGRWDARIALDPSLAPKLADPFEPLPVCSPGMLVGPDGLPARKDGIASEEWMRARSDAITPPPDGSVENLTIPDAEYPLAVDWDGILVDDPDHPDDVTRRVRGVLELLWGDRADAVEGEACELLGVKDLRAYFRNPRQFFEHHVKRHSKSRRKAPIYWLLQSPKRNYGLWLYYHRRDPDILFKALHKYVEPKVRLEESRLDEYEARRKSAGTAGREAKQAERAVAKQEELLTDLREFRDRLDRAAKLHLRPDLNDGVVLNSAPLHELMPQPWKEAKSKWNELLAGKYEWSSIGKQLREKGMV